MGAGMSEWMAEYTDPLQKRITELKAENERLKADNKILTGDYTKIERLAVERMVEMDGLKKENERLKAELVTIRKEVAKVCAKIADSRAGHLHNLPEDVALEIRQKFNIKGEGE